MPGHGEGKKKDEEGKGGHGDAHAGHGGDHEEHEGGHGEGHGGHDGNDGHDGHGNGEEGHGNHGDEHGGGHGDGHGNESHEEHKHEEKKERETPKKRAPRLKRNFSFSEVATIVFAAVIIRVALKQSDAFISIEPIIPLAVYAGLKYGADAGILVGLFSYPLSNLFLIGGTFGLWSFLQGLGGGISGWLGGNARAMTKAALFQYSILGTLAFELIVNFPDQQLLVWPFSIVHIASNAVIALLIGELLIKEK